MKFGIIVVLALMGVPMRVVTTIVIAFLLMAALMEGGAEYVSFLACGPREPPAFYRTYGLEHVNDTGDVMNRPAVTIPEDRPVSEGVDLMIRNKIKRLPVEDTLASLKAVVFGTADAALGEAAVIQTLISKNMLAGLQISGEVKLGNPDLTNMRLAVRDDWHASAPLVVGPFPRHPPPR